MRLLVAGSLHLDIVVRAPHLPALDETVAGTGVDYVFGGKGGNQAVAAARMGADAAFLGRAGSDAFGTILRATLADSGVDTTLLQEDDGASGMSTAIVDDNGDYGAVIVSAANLRIDTSRVRIPDGTSLVLLQNEIPEAVNLAVASHARSIGARLWLNAAPARPLSSALLSLVDMLIVNRVEAAAYGALPNSVTCLTTLGSDGVRYDGRHSPGYAVDVVSTHGAGDMFVGALAAEVVRGEELDTAIGFAQAAAALHVSSSLEERARLAPERVFEFMETQPRR
ncbi:ribokinase [Roseobacter sp. YSTF-M11]|uniref:Ribokinase n=1 Tax=Roseobacter insulae TaxID=2859783 RepID=A0A9X1FV17_9RHOB|nr:PfkB family carbohydrate kinase [Roseobacter insulae]MBW4707393.1 ribokinase [Roseobacter insulae]